MATAADLTGLNPDIQSLKRSVAAFRPHLERLLRERRGIELLALYTYPAQVVFCNKAFASLGDLAGRRVRVSSASQADLIEALGAKPVNTGFAEIMPPSPAWRASARAARRRTHRRSRWPRSNCR